MTDYPIANSTLRRRKPLPRGKPLPRATTPIKRTVRVKAKNSRRKGHRFPKHVLEEFRAWVREQPCCVTGLRTGMLTCLPVVGWTKVRVDPAHVRARSLGGPDAANIVPLVRHLHDELGPETQAAAVRGEAQRGTWARWRWRHGSDT